MKKTFSLTNLPLRNKTIFLRVDYNIPLKNKTIQDNTKIKASLPTLNYLLKKNCKIILATHLGRPQGKIVPKLRVDPIAKELKKLLPRQNITKLNDCLGKEIKEEIQKAKPRQLFLLENLRFYKEEKENNLAFAHSLANLADFYINNAFAVSHRKHASVDAITHFLPSAPGFLLEKEIKNLSLALKPKRPFTWLIGGAKLDKINLIQSALKKANHILIGGALAFSFLKAKGYNVGMSKTDTQSINIAKKILKKKKNRKKIILPLDVVVAPHISSKAKTRTVPINQIPTNQTGLDLGSKTINLFKQYLKNSKTIVWSGPLGYFELKPFRKATKSIALFLSKLKATTIIGGGETSEAIHQFKLARKMTWVSTGGGASLEFLTGKKLPGIAALERNYKRFRKKIKKQNRTNKN